MPRAGAQAVWLPPGLRRDGLIIGIFFGLDFLFLYWGLAFTNASRAVIFLYTQVFWVALGAHFLVKGDRLTWLKSTGLVLAFAGVLAVFLVRPQHLSADYWIGDLMSLAAALCWAASTVYLKMMTQRPGPAISHFQTLFAQLAWSLPLLALASALLEWGRPVNLDLVVSASLFYQSVVVAAFSYVLWFWMIHRFRVTGLICFTFLTPMFGVILGAAVLGEVVAPLVWLGMALVGLGIYLVNR